MHKSLYKWRDLLSKCDLAYKIVLDLCVQIEKKRYIYIVRVDRDLPYSVGLKRFNPLGFIIVGSSSIDIAIVVSFEKLKTNRANFYNFFYNIYRNTHEYFYIYDCKKEQVFGYTRNYYYYSKDKECENWDIHYITNHQDELKDMEPRQLSHEGLIVFIFKLYDPLCKEFFTEEGDLLLANFNDINFSFFFSYCDDVKITGIVLKVIDQTPEEPYIM